MAAQDPTRQHPLQGAARLGVLVACSALLAGLTGCFGPKEPSWSELELRRILNERKAEDAARLEADDPIELIAESPTKEEAAQSLNAFEVSNQGLVLLAGEEFEQGLMRAVATLREGDMLQTRDGASALRESRQTLEDLGVVMRQTTLFQIASMILMLVTLGVVVARTKKT